MDSPTFGMLPGNNAPLPPFFAGNNPTGGASKQTGGGFPSFPLFGTSSSGLVSPTANMPLFGNSGGVGGLSSGLSRSFTGQPGNPGDHLYKELTSAYGKGAGASIFDLLTKGLYNPQIANAFLNSMQPGINRGEANLMNSFGAEGSRFSSTAALGEGDYLSQVNLNEQQTLASMYMQAQQEQMGLLENVMPTLHAEEANKGGLFSDILGGIEGVASLIPGVGGAVASIMKMLTPNKSSTPIPQATPQTVSSGTPPFMPTSVGSTPQDFWQQYFTGSLSASGATALGGQ